MLVSFLKEKQSDAVNLKVIKFTDRIWIDNKDEEIGCQRDVFFSIEDNSIKEFSMLMPLIEISDLRDNTENLLAESNVFNKSHTGAYELVDKEKRLFSIDNIEGIYAPEMHPPVKRQEGNCQTISIIFRDNINGPKVCAFSIKFKIKAENVIKEMSDGENLLKLSYFQSRDCQKECQELSVFEREIKAITILDMKTKRGGLDVIVYLPFGVRDAHADHSPQETYREIKEDGSSSSRSRVTFIWHLREFFSNIENEEITCSNNTIPVLSIKYNEISTDKKLNMLDEKLDNSISSLESKIKTQVNNGDKELKRGQNLAFILTIFSIILAGCSLALTMFF